MNPPSTPETEKYMALQKSVKRFFNFSTWLQKDSEESGRSVEDLISNENRRDTVCRFLELDPEKIKQENIMLMEHLTSISNNTSKENS